MFSGWSSGSSHTPSGLLLVLFPSYEALTWLLVIHSSHVPHTLSLSIFLPFFFQDRHINTSQNVLICDYLHHIIFTAARRCSVVFFFFLELLILQSGSINSTQWIWSWSSSSSCLRSSLAGSLLAQWVCILNAPLASMREMIGRINCGWRAEWE